jgi:hypothetical protein
MLALPLWVVTEHIQPTEPEKPASNDPGSAMAFTSQEKLLDYRKMNRGGEWKLEMADDRDGLLILIADLHRLGVESFTLDSENDGTGGEQVTLPELANYAASLIRPT